MPAIRNPKRNGCRSSHRRGICVIGIVCLIISGIWRSRRVNPVVDASSYRFWMSSSSTENDDEDATAATAKNSVAQETTLVVPAGNNRKEPEEEADAPWKRHDPNRTIVFVHVGKAAGMTVRKATSLLCRLNTKIFNTHAKIQNCMDRKFLKDAVLSRQVQYYFHMHGYPKEDIQASTSFLVSLRNPVDRIISTFRYSHPENCNKKEYKYETIRPWGCYAANYWKTKGTQAYLVYNTCFPSSDMEDFAQSVIMSSSGTNNTNDDEYNSSAHFQSLSPKQQRACGRTARRMVQGKGPMFPAPHMYYNYHYYANKTLLEFPSKEVFGLRTDQIWKDLKELDLAIGGRGMFVQEGRLVSHGSEQYQHTSPISKQAYHKLCCVLEQEIALYLDIVDRVLNLDKEEKRTCMQDIQTKCGIPTSTSWEEWRQSCR